MKRVKVAVWGAGTLVERGVLPVLSGADATAPPDAGVGWAKRPVSGGALRYRSAAKPEVVALCDENAEACERVADGFRVRARYADPRAMLREVAPDALIIAPSAAQIVAIPPMLRFLASQFPDVRTFTMPPPAPSGSEMRGLQRDLGARATSVWPAQVGANAFAHRAARRAVEEGEIGRVNAVTLRANVGFSASPPASPDDWSRFANSYAALQLLLGALSWTPVGRDGFVTTQGAASTIDIDGVSCGARDGVTTLWLRGRDGASATALLSSGDVWGATLPRLELFGSEGRAIGCEGGRRVTITSGREAARLLEAPSGGLFPSEADVSGLAPELRAFLISCATEVDERRALRAWAQSVRTLELLEAARASLSGEVVSHALPRPLPAGGELGSDVAPTTEPVADSRPAPARPRAAKTSAVDAPTLPL